MRCDTPLVGVARARVFEPLQLDREARVDAKPKAFACCKDCVPAFLRVAAPLRAFDKRDLFMTKAYKVIDGFAITERVVNANPRAPDGAAVSADCHG
jgi:hypothetical protein